MTDNFRESMKMWFEQDHPGGRATFGQVKQRKVKAVTRDQAQFHFGHTLKGSEWEIVKGWHCLRHSFISNLACAGIDQRIIDEFFIIIQTKRCVEETAALLLTSNTQQLTTFW